ncbi:hypothetical protein LSUE1_G007332 [Lachnellula suecica]|uniref:Homeobox domain-containing protein n=1 Tax=Lachnellula suecica TaxID=602035 RepID=A0A8T9CAW4_9HELO|nr:hypothetical protein LSUE1_G007332 [Lachnellula suecica]
MEYLDAVYQQYPHHQGMPQYSDAQHSMHNNAMAQQAGMMPMPTAQKTNETKPRLGKDEVDILEREFKKNPKPTTQTKRQFAEDMAVDLARINNWFQNRRAKRKQEKKQEAYEAGQAQEALAYSDGASSPDYNYGNGYYNDTHMVQQSSAPFPVMTGPPPPVAPYNPQYEDPSSASMESLHRTMAAAHAATQQQDFHGSFSEPNDPLTAFGGSLIHDSSDGDRAQFPPSSSSMSHFDNHQSFSFPSVFTNNNIYNSPPSAAELHTSPVETATQTPTQFNTYGAARSDSNGSQPVTTFPSQLLGHGQIHDGLPSQSSDSSNSQSPENSNGGSLQLDFKFENPESDEVSDSPPAPTIPFKSPPPMDIASRRKKVSVRPAALTSETLRNRPSMGPRTVSHAEGFRRPAVESPMSSPMRRIVSAGGNRNVLTGRIYKSGIESAQRSPINLNGFADAGAFMEANIHSIRNPPSLTALSSLSSSLAPPTPMSPREREMTLANREGRRSTASPHEGHMAYVFTQGAPGCFAPFEGDQNLASPPETPQAQMVLQAGNGWSNGNDFQEKQWNNYEVHDEPLYTPAQDGFPLELQMPQPQQPQYLSNFGSQPVTPAFGQHFNPNFVFGHESPQFKNESPQYTLSTQGHSEYSFPDGQGHYPIGLSPLTKQKTFQFSNTTAADFSEK